MAKASRRWRSLMSDAPDYFFAYCSVSTAAGHLMAAHAINHHDKSAADRRRELAVEEIDKAAAVFALELVPRTEVVTR